MLWQKRQLHKRGISMSNELYHHGVLGQKWGVRRYQNKDGTLTNAGRKRQTKLENEYYKLTGKNKIKKISEMSDDELKQKINRKKLENEYERLYLREKRGVGEKIVSKFLNDALLGGSVSAGKKYIEKQLLKSLK